MDKIKLELRNGHHGMSVTNKNIHRCYCERNNSEREEFYRLSAFFGTVPEKGKSIEIEVLI